ncbi:MAG: RNA 2',3'-cyclic phosphodiesterase [Gammaproteobacteria bacterium]|nr:RNA 2',3'-cyclic phosphodiesterase [Gammaproteobacteria bacterium]
MRLFLALELPAATASSIGDWRDRSVSSTGRPVPVANFHVTLAFIGRLQPRKLEALADTVAASCMNDHFHADALLLDQVGFWPKPGIFWLGPQQWSNNLAKLASRLQHTAQAFGAAADKRPYQPHVTLYRGCDLPPPHPVLAPHFRFAFDQVVLYASRSGRSGVSYHCIEHFPLVRSAG